MQKLLVPICVAVLIVSAAVVAWVYWSVDAGEMSDTIREAIRVDIAKTFTQLAVLGVIGAFIKWLLEGYDSFRRERDARDRAKRELWRDLRQVYAEVMKARDLIDAEQTPLAYGAQLSRLMDARASLGEIRHEVKLWPGLFKQDEEIAERILQMERYLDDQLIQEYRNNYAALSGAPSLAAAASQLPMLQDYLSSDEGGLFHTQFRMNYFEARTEILQDLLA